MTSRGQKCASYLYVMYLYLFMNCKCIMLFMYYYQKIGLEIFNVYQWITNLIKYAKLAFRSGHLDIPYNL